MTELLCVALLYLASALIYATTRRRRTLQPAWASTRLSVAAARIAALACIASAFALWRTIEPGPAAFLVILTGQIVSGTLFALIAPVAPRLIACATALCLLAIPTLLSLGAVP
jgi:hypothetical protein